MSAAGLAADDARILTLENPSAFDSTVRKRRVVLIGSGDPRAADAVVAAVRWLKTSAPRAVRDRWVASALPLPGSRAEDVLSMEKWLAFQAPDLVVRVGAGDVQFSGVRVETIPAAAPADTLRKLL